MAGTLLHWFAKSPAPGSSTKPVSELPARSASDAQLSSSSLGNSSSLACGGVPVSAVDIASRPASKHYDEVTLPIKRLWFEKIASGDKRVEFRDASPFWRGRLLERTGLQRVRFLNGRSVDAPRMVCALERVELMPVSDIPRGLAPPPGTSAHRELFRGAQEVICLHLGRILQIHDPKMRRDTEEQDKDPSVMEPVDVALLKRVTGGGEDEIRPRKCGRVAKAPLGG